MLGAAPTCKPYRGVLFLLAIVAGGLATLLISTANAQAEVQKGRAHVAPVWGVALDGRQPDQPNLELLAQAKAAGVNAIVTDPKRWSTERHRRLASLARGLGMFLIEPRRPSKDAGSATELRARCKSGLQAHRPCAFVAKSAPEAVELARRGTVDYVVLRLGSPADLKLVNAKRSTRTELITVLTVGESAKLDSSWDEAIDSARQDPKTTLATGLSGAFAATAIRDYFSLLQKHDAGAATFDQTQGDRGSAGSRDRLPPTAPLAATVASTSATSIVLKWTASTDNVGVAGYGIYLGATSIGSTAATTFTVNGLQCGSTYTFAIDAYDRRRNRSQKVAVTGATGSCPLPPPASPTPSTPSSPPSSPSAPADRTDKTRPSRPDGLVASGATQSSMSLTWNPSTDNVGVVRYEILTGKRSVGTTTTTSYLVTGLSCGTTYQMGVRAYDAAGNNSVSATIRVGTARCSSPSGDTQAPTTPGNVHLVSSTGSSVTLAWSASADNVGVTGYGVYRDGNLAGSTNSTSYTVAGLACGTNYTIAVDAYDAAGNHSQRATITTSTSSCPPAADTQAPSIPTNVHVAGATPTSVTVAWTASTDNVGVTGYTVYNGAAASGNTTSTSYTVVGLSCGATYALAVDAFDAVGNRSSKASVSATTNACAPPPPAPAPTRSVSQNIPGGSTLFGSFTWTATPSFLSGTSGNPSVKFLIDGVEKWTENTSPYQFNGDPSGVLDTKTLANGPHTFKVTAAWTDGTSASATATATVSNAAPPPPAATSDTQAPTVPGGLRVTAATASSVTVAWTASTDNVGVTGYTVYNGAAASGNTTSTSYTVVGLSCGATYALAVEAFDAAGNRSAKASVTGSTSACPPAADTQAPTVPGALHVTAATATSITVAWNVSTDNVSVSGYGLYRGGTSIGTTSSTSATFSGLVCGTGYTLAVDAYDAAGNRSSKASISAPTGACAPPAPAPDTQPPAVPGGLRATSATGSSITVAWTASTDNVGVTGYGLYRNGTSTGTTASLSATFSGLSCGTGYTLAVDAFDAAGNRSAKASITASTSACPPPADTQPPTVPGGLRATAATATSIAVAWTASSDNVAVTGYGVYNGTSNVGSTASTSYTVSGLSCGTAYTISVDAYDAAGNRSGKASMSASTAACSAAASGTGVYVSTTGNDSTCVRGDQSKPCATLNRAYSIAVGGDTISVACGTYGGQSIPARSLGTSVVTIKKSGSCAYVVLNGGIRVDASYVTLDGFQATNNTNIHIAPRGGSPCAPNHVTIQNFKVSAITGGCDTVTIRNGDVGTNQNACGGPEDGIQLFGYTPNGQFSSLSPPTNMLVDGVTIHDTSGFSQCGQHTDGFQAFGCNNCTIRNSVFMRNDTSDVIIYQITGAQSDIQSILLENNSFGSVKNPGHGVSIGGAACPSDQPNNVVVRNNTFYTAATVDVNCPQKRIAGTVRNNVFAAPDGSFVCLQAGRDFVADYNVFASAGCGAHSKVCVPLFVDPSHGGGNIDLSAADSCAKNYVPAVSGTYPATDIGGTPRPQGSAVDAGADEAG
jgi:chitodextrinase